jgi:CxxC motif-containing protein (DUF1111 family)
MSAYRPERTPAPRATAPAALLLALGLAPAGALGGAVTPQPKMSDPLEGLTTAQLAQFMSGQTLYNTNMDVSDGLGPIFNKESCGNCHANPLGGPGSQTVTRAGLADKGGFDPLAQFGGSLFQQQAISEECKEVVHASATVMSLRVTNGMMGYGLVEAILDDDVEANADPTDSNGDGISGRVHWAPAIEDPPMSPLRAGRFGWKAQDPTIFTFTAGASFEEIGLTNPFHPDENDPNGINPPDLTECTDGVPDPDVGMSFLDDVTNFQRFLAPPPQTPKSGMAGEALFVSVGCAKCHVQSFTTPDDAGLEDAIRDKLVRPYSDFLLHDMGQAADFIPQGDATDRELKTAPLMGLRRRDPLWHDGRFAGGTFTDRVTLAILEHFKFGSEPLAANVDDNWNALTPTQKSQIIAFLASLGRPEFDSDGNDDITIADFIDFNACVGGPYTPDDPCAIHDIDQDGDVDGDDYASFLVAYQGPPDDCNDNGELDVTDIFTGASDDLDGNGIPDECQPCFQADLDGDAMVGFADLLQVLSSWGKCPLCPEDIDGNGFVDFLDLLQVLSNWGSCL